MAIAREVIAWGSINANGSIAFSKGLSGVSNVSTLFTYTFDVQQRHHDLNVASRCSVFGNKPSAYTSIALKVTAGQVVAVDVQTPIAAFDFEIVRYT